MSNHLHVHLKIVSWMSERICHHTPLGLSQYPNVILHDRTGSYMGLFWLKRGPVHWPSLQPLQWRDLVDGKGKGKLHPKTGHEGPEVKHSSTLSLTSVLDRGWRPGEHGNKT